MSIRPKLNRASNYKAAIVGGKLVVQDRNSTTGKVWAYSVTEDYSLTGFKTKTYPFSDLFIAILDGDLHIQEKVSRFQRVYRFPNDPTGIPSQWRKALGRAGDLQVFFDGERIVFRGQEPFTNRYYHFRAGRVARSVNVGDGAYTLHNGHPFLLRGNVIYGAPVRSNGSGDLRVFSHNIGKITTLYDTTRTTVSDDDHNNGNVIIDPVNLQLGVPSTDHNNSSNVYFYRSGGLDVASLANKQTVTVTNASYSSGFICPADLDQLDIFTREGSSAASTWRVLRTEDYTAATPSFVEYDFLDEAYIDVRAGTDGNDIWIMASGSASAPNGSQDSARNTSQSLVLWKLDRSDDSLTSGATTMSSDITGAFTALHMHGWNLLEASDDLTAVDTTDQCNDTTGTVTDPWGYSNTGRNIFVFGTGSKRWAQLATATVAQNDIIEHSCYVKAKGSDKIMLGDTAGLVTAGSPLAYFDLTAGTTNGGLNQNGDQYIIEDIGGGWYRIGIKFTVTEAAGGTPEFRITVTDDSYALSYAAGTESVWVRCCQTCHSLDSSSTLRDYSQNRTAAVAAKVPSTAPLVVYNAGELSGGMEMVRLLDYQEIGSFIEVAFVVADDRQTGSEYPSQGGVYYTRVNTTTWAVDTPVLVGQAGDGLNTGDASGTNYLGGCIMGAYELLYDRQNLNGNGKGQIVRATSTDGTTWTNEVIAESPTEILMRPIAIPEQTYTGGTLSWSLSKWFAYMKGSYTNYDAGNFDTEVVLARLED